MERSVLTHTAELTPFHLAIAVRDIEEAREFYGTKMGFPEGRSCSQWIDFNMFGHQLVVHLNSQHALEDGADKTSNLVDGHAVPIPHFGVVLTLEKWQELAQRLQGFIQHFIVEPHIRFAGEPGEQATLFFTDPSGNALEFKAFKDIERDLFAT
ncbi:MAG: extradiol dioxygenase family protein [Halioglobus sp.]|jgi:extradiol dioxygenase family protein